MYTLVFSTELDVILFRYAILLNYPIRSIVIVIVLCLGIHQADQRSQDQTTTDPHSC